MRWCITPMCGYMYLQSVMSAGACAIHAKNFIAYQSRSKGVTGMALLLCESLSGTLDDLEIGSSVAAACP